jgi:CRISPR-associated protein Csx16
MSQPTTKVWFVSRHPGALEWARRQGLRWSHALTHLDNQPVAAGDIVYGTLPVQLAARVCEAGAEYWHLQVPLGEGMRGRELSAEELADAGARFVRYDVKTLGERT